jgi:hypothetical protein
MFSLVVFKPLPPFYLNSNLNSTQLSSTEPRWHSRLQNLSKLYKYPLSIRTTHLTPTSNTAQILTSFVEALDSARPSTSSETEPIDPLPLLEEALNIFQRCLTLQEYQHTESLAQAEAVSAEPTTSSADLDPDTEEGGVPLTSQPTESGGNAPEPPQEDRWATILEPVTNTTLLDTLLAQLSTLTTLSSLVPASNTNLLSWIEEYSTSLLSQKLPTYLSGTDREQEAGLTRANFLSSLADAKFRSQRMDLITYAQVLEDAFAELESSSNAKGLCDRAEALIAFNSAVRLMGESEASEMRWKALTSALGNLTAATKLPDAENVGKMHLLRGDVELLRFQLGDEGYGIAAKNAATLLKNAEKFYRGAKVLAQRGETHGDRQVFAEAMVMEVLAADLRREPGRLAILRDAVKGESGGGAKGILEDAVEDGLVTLEQLSRMGIV